MKKITIHTKDYTFETDKTQIDFKDWGVEFVGIQYGRTVTEKYRVPWNAIEYVSESLTSSAPPSPEDSPVEESS